LFHFQKQQDTHREVLPKTVGVVCLVQDLLHHRVDLEYITVALLQCSTVQ
jgi:hypothetical protein